MTESELKMVLRLWGRWFGLRDTPATVDGWDEDRSDELHGDTHVLMRAIRVGTKAAPRTPRTRTYTMPDGRKATEAAPSNVCYGKQSQGGSKPTWVNPLAEHIEVTVLGLYNANRIRYAVLRAEYCTGRARKTEKAAIASQWLDARITKRKFHEELELAHAYLLGAFSNVAKFAA